MSYASEAPSSRWTASETPMHALVSLWVVGARLAGDIFVKTVMIEDEFCAAIIILVLGQRYLSTSTSITSCRATVGHILCTIDSRGIRLFHRSRLRDE